MVNIKKILVPTDFSDNAATAYQPAQQIATRYGAIVDFIHIIPTLNYCSESMSSLGVPLLMGEDLYSKMQEHASKKIDGLMHEFIELKNKGKGIVRTAPKPSQAIADFAEYGDYDLIVMAAKGHHEAEFLKGSITKKVIRYSTIPVFSTEESTLQLKNIVVPTDGSQTSLKALPLAISFALTFDATITIFNVLTVHRPLLNGTTKDLLEKAYKKLRAEIFEGVKTFFAQSWDQIELQEEEGGESRLIYHQGTSKATIKLKTIVQEEISKYDALTEYANEQADMVIMATHGWRGLSHFLIGSVAETIARELELPVVTVNPDIEKMKSIIEEDHYV